MIHEICLSPRPEGTEEAVRWSDLELNVTVLPEWEQTALKLMEEALGYLPHRAVRLPYEPYLRGLLQGLQQSQLTKDAFDRAAEDHLKLVRNADMVIYLQEPTPHFQNMYREHFKLYGLPARQRLAGFLGYEPLPNYSLMAELWLWDLMSRAGIQLPECLTAVDYKAITIIRYREIMFTESKEAADVSPLIGLLPFVNIDKN